MGRWNRVLPPHRRASPRERTYVSSAGKNPLRESCAFRGVQAKPGQTRKPATRFDKYGSANRLDGWENSDSTCSPEIVAENCA
jgi:hypothetical protein